MMNGAPVDAQTMASVTHALGGVVDDYFEIVSPT
jgi:hypothetical protein